MPPVIALLLTSAFVFWLLNQDWRRTSGVTNAHWVPLLWLLIISSRFVSEWLNLGPPLYTPDDFLDGSPVDRAVFLALIAAALWIAYRRRMFSFSLFSVNCALAIYVAYGGVSVLWSDYPFVAFKRWVKVLGHPLMVLVLLSEPNPHQAVRALFRRCAFVLIPFSILLIKYYPALGRGFSEWTGAAFNTGVAGNKNLLGILLILAGFFFAWNLLAYRRWMVPENHRHEIVSSVLMLAMTLWLFRQADSATAFAACLLGIGVVFFLGWKRLREGPLIFFLGCSVLIFFLLDALFDLSGASIVALGRDATLTDRTELWRDVLSIPINPLVGAGFESFWLGERATTLWGKWWWRPNQAHNGYLETYLTGGWIGVLCLGGLIVSCYRKAKADLVSSPAYGRLRMGFLAILLAYSYTEAPFKALHPLFFVLFLIAMDRGALGEDDASKGKHSESSRSPNLSRKGGASSDVDRHVVFPGRSPRISCLGGASTQANRVP
jgi:exopolysaccharide production protein ExoQ